MVTVQTFQHNSSEISYTQIEPKITYSTRRPQRCLLQPQNATSGVQEDFENLETQFFSFLGFHKYCYMHFGKLFQIVIPSDYLPLFLLKYTLGVEKILKNYVHVKLCPTIHSKISVSLRIYYNNTGARSSRRS